MAKRKSLSKKTRFEVFKRDNFTCQYCGRSAPDVTLEVDHIVPVAEGGTNDIMNLITSCFDCNRGKGKNKLSDNSVVQKQKQQLDELNSKKEQTKMMLQWKHELENILDENVDYLCEYWEKKTGCSFTDSGMKILKSRIRDFGVVEVETAIDISCEKYINGTSYGNELAWKKVGGICYNRKHKLWGKK